MRAAKIIMPYTLKILTESRLSLLHRNNPFLGDNKTIIIYTNECSIAIIEEQ